MSKYWQNGFHRVNTDNLSLPPTNIHTYTYAETIHINTFINQDSLSNSFTHFVHKCEFTHLPDWVNDARPEQYQIIIIIHYVMLPVAMQMCSQLQHSAVLLPNIPPGCCNQLATWQRQNELVSVCIRHSIVPPSPCLHTVDTSSSATSSLTLSFIHHSSP